MYEILHVVRIRSDSIRAIGFLSLCISAHLQNNYRFMSINSDRDKCAGRDSIDSPISIQVDITIAVSCRHTVQRFAWRPVKAKVMATHQAKVKAIPQAVLGPHAA